MPRLSSIAAPEQPERVPAAQYVRMSTDMQEFSIANQKATISDFAARLGYCIVKTYSDAGRSGVCARNRPGLCQLLSDVINRNADFKAILVYDVSRWGRFQNSDEAGHYEFLCQRVGIPIFYCAEPFANDGSIVSGLMKNLKRIMASEYSRELGVKTFAGQARLAREGFKLGGRAGFGLRRMMVSADEARARVLNPGQHKSIKTDRVVYVLGPQRELKCVRAIFAMALRGIGYSAIARELNRRKIVRETGAAWNYEIVKDVLTNPKYMGCNVWGRSSQRLHGPCLQIPRERWITRQNAFPAIIDPAMFNKAQQKLRKHIASLHWTNEKLLSKLAQLQTRRGKITTGLLNRTPGMPNSQTVARRFGGLPQAYKLIGYSLGEKTTQRCLAQSQTFALRDRMVKEILQKCPEFTITRLSGRPKPLLLLDGTVIVCLKFCAPTRIGNILTWNLNNRPPHNDEITLLCRRQPDSGEIHSMYVMPKRKWRTCYRFKGDPEWLSEGVPLENVEALAHVVRNLVSHVQC